MRTIIFCEKCGKLFNFEVGNYQAKCAICGVEKYEYNCIFCGHVGYVETLCCSSNKEKDLCEHERKNQREIHECEKRKNSISINDNDDNGVCARRSNDRSMSNYYVACRAAETFSKHYHG